MNELTEAERAILNKWKQIAYDSTPIDKQAAAEAVNLLYTCGDMEPPTNIEFFDGPKSLAKRLKSIDQYKNLTADGLKKISMNSSNDIYREVGALQLELHNTDDEEEKQTKANKLAGVFACAKKCGFMIPLRDHCFVVDKAWKTAGESK
jgi:hypothetical protein